MIMPKYRSGLYTVWRSCERLSILPPHVASDFDDCDSWTQCLLMAYGQIRDNEEFELQAKLAGAKIGV